MVRPLWVFVFLACASTVPAGPPAPPPPLPPATLARTPAGELGSLEREVARAVNEHRRAGRLQALAYDTALASVARDHSVAMSRGRVPLGHDGFASRADQVERLVPFKQIAENVALNDYPRARTVRVAMDGWLKSPHHRENIEGEFDLTGVGIAQSGDGTYYYTQVFVARQR